MDLEPKQDGFSLLREMLDYDAKIMCRHDRMVMADSAQGRGGFMKYSEPSEEYKRMGYVVGHARCLAAPNPISDESFYKYGMNADNATLCSSEWRVARILLRDCKFLPNFMRPYGVMTNKVIVEPRRAIDETLQITELKDFDPFNITQHGTMVRRVVDVGIFESLRLLQPGNKLANMGNEVIASTIYQLAMAILIAQQRCKFAHNDLHIDNVMLASCPYNLCLFYNYMRENGTAVRRIVPTYGIIPVIIDYGFAYVNDHDNHHPEVLFADNLGYITYEHDNTVDITRILHEFTALLPDTPLSHEIGTHLKELNISADGRHKLGARVANSWEAADRAVQAASYVALYSDMPKNNRFDRMIHDAIKVKNGIVHYDCRVRNLVLYNGTMPEDELIMLDFTKLENTLLSDLAHITNDPDARGVVCSALSAAVRHSTEVLNTAAIKSTSRTPEDLQLNRLNLKMARSQFLTLATSRLSSTKRKACLAALPRIKTCNSTRMVSTLFAMVCIRMVPFLNKLYEDVVHVRRSIKLPVRRYSSPSHSRNHVEELRTAFGRFYSKWNVWRDEASIGSEVNFVARRSLSRVILDNTRTARSSTETTYSIDMSETKKALMRRMRIDLDAFNKSNNEIYSDEVRHALQVMENTILVDWYNICYAWAEITAVAANMFNNSVLNLRKFRAETIHAAVGSGEKLFFKYEESLYRYGRVRCTRPLTDPVLIIDSVEGTSRMCDVGMLQELKRGAIVKRKRDDAPIQVVQTANPSPGAPMDCTPKQEPQLQKSAKRACV